MKLEEIIGKEFDPSKIEYKTTITERKEGANFIRDKQEEEKEPSSMWAVMGSSYMACHDTVEKLPAGVYTAGQTMSGDIFFTKINMISDEIIELPDDNSSKILEHIEFFWSLKDKFNEHGYLHKRGILLYGPAGSGKTSTVIQTLRSVVEKGGIALIGDYPRLDSAALHELRSLEPDRPIVTLYEDVDDTIYMYGDRALTALLDGERNINGVLYIATTNYPERLPPRLVNRPSRFDIIQFIGLPSEKARYAYLEAKTDLSVAELRIWAQKTDKLSIPHLKELIILVTIYEKDLDESITRLKSMSRLPHSSTFDNSKDFNININLEKEKTSVPSVNPPVINVKVNKNSNTKVIRNKDGLIEKLETEETEEKGDN